MRENDLQRLLVDYCKAVLPGSAVIFAVPNAARRTRAGRAANAVPGLMRGVSDLLVLPAPRTVLFVECKTVKGTMSAHQLEFANSVRSLGFHFAVWRSIEDARNTFAALSIPTREAH